MNIHSLTNKSGEQAVLQFAKWPELGKVKTRMQPHLSAAQSLLLHRRLLSYCSQNLCRQGAWSYELHLACNHNDLEERFPKNIVSELGLAGEPSIWRQVEGNLGCKMRSAAEQALEHYRRIVIVGSDCPFVSADYIEQAFLELEHGADVVIGPASDGGYVLLAMNQTVLTHGLGLLFDDMPWSQETLCEYTLQRLQSTTLTSKLLTTLSDIDRPEDLDLLAGIPTQQVWY